ncbi:MAG: hypothetical protein ABSD08_19840, partial [Xanthobacteraceae bacterium]
EAKPYPTPRSQRRSQPIAPLIAIADIEKISPKPTFFSSLLVPCVGARPAQFVLLPIFRVIIHNFTRQLFDHILAARGILAASQFRHRFCERGDDFVRIDRFRLIG